MHSRKANTFTFFPQAYMENFDKCAKHKRKKHFISLHCPMSLFFILRFAYFSKFSMYAWGKKEKKVSFSRVHVCVKAKLTLVSFFYFFFYAPFPKRIGLRESI